MCLSLFILSTQVYSISPSQPPSLNNLLFISYRKGIWSEMEAKNLRQTKREITENMDREISFEKSRTAQAQTPFRFDSRKKFKRNRRICLDFTRLSPLRWRINSNRSPHLATYPRLDPVLAYEATRAGTIAVFRQLGGLSWLKFRLKWWALFSKAYVPCTVRSAHELLNNKYKYKKCTTEH